MQKMHLFECATVRIVPRVEREEFMNVGVIMYCAGEHFLKMKFCVDEKRLLNFANNIDITELKKRLQAIEFICNGNAAGGTIATYPAASRFRWLTAVRSTIIQTSPVHPGFCSNAQEKLEKLFAALVA